MARSALLNVMVQTALKAGKTLTRDFGEVQNLQVSVKGPGEFVAQAARKSEKVCREELLKARPTYGFTGGEGEDVKGSDGAHRWIIEPLDGTTNFQHGIPMFSISVALERNGEVAAAVIYNPATDELFTAERGGGAFVNDRRLRVSGRKVMSDCVISCSVPHLGHGMHGRFLVQLRHMMGEAAGIRHIGAASLDLAYVAAGRFDGYWEELVKPAAMAAGILLVREAGGYVTDLAGVNHMMDNGDVMSGNEHIHKAIGEIINRPVPTR